MGVRSMHSVRAYARDILTWLRFLKERRGGKTVWQADREEVAAYHAVRRLSALPHCISAASWNRNISALEKLYRWGVEEELILSTPFTYRHVWGGSLIAFLDGSQDLWLASCTGFYDSPFGTKGKACPVPFWGCLECRNAVITSRKLPALIAFVDFMIAQRAELMASDWAVKFGRAYQRITEQILPAFPEAVVAAGRVIAASRADVLYLPPEAGVR